jgi:peptidoglycan/xylan/chitin deacetylase (PgdA/CDA1 family)
MSHFSVEKFRLLCKELKDRNINTITTSLAKNCVDNYSKKCLLTFDDGLECVYTHALPVMEEYGQKSMIFCVAGFIGRKSSWDVYSEQSHLTSNQIREISQLGHEIGSHTQTHANLVFLNDKDLSSELHDSKKILEDITGKSVTSLSFPHGSWNKRVWDKAQEIGYTTATIYRDFHTADQSLFPVYGIYHFDSIADIYEKINTQKHLLLNVAFSKMMSQFSKGTPIWKFRDNYKLFIK